MSHFGLPHKPWSKTYDPPKPPRPPRAPLRFLTLSSSYRMFISYAWSITFYKMCEERSGRIQNCSTNQRQSAWLWWQYCYSRVISVRVHDYDDSRVICICEGRGDGARGSWGWRSSCTSNAYLFKMILPNNRKRFEQFRSLPTFCTLTIVLDQL